MLNKFITIEGGEGCGKSTLCKRLSELLNEKNIDHLITREPGGVDSSEAIRNVIMNHEVDHKSEVLLFAAARNEHLKEKIIPELNKGKYVICDRYVDSSLAYQGHAQGLGIDTVLNINKYVIEENFPRLTFWLDMDVEDALGRISANREVNRFDKKTKDFHQKVRDGYQQVMNMYPERYIKLDANKPVDELALIVLNEILCLK